MTVLISKNLPLAGLVALGGRRVWSCSSGGWSGLATSPRPRGCGSTSWSWWRFMGYLLLLLYSQMRYLWLWRSLLQLFRQLSLLPMAGAFDRIPPRVAAKFGRFLRTSLQDDIDLEIPLQQCRLVLDGRAGAPRRAVRCPSSRPSATRSAAHHRVADERFEIVSKACVRPVIELGLAPPSLEQAYGGSMAGVAGTATTATPAGCARRGSIRPRSGGWDRPRTCWRCGSSISSASSPARCGACRLSSSTGRSCCFWPWPGIPSIPSG